MTDATRAAFRERMVSAVRYFAAAPDEIAARRELASLLAYGSGAIALFDEILAELGKSEALPRPAVASLKAFAVHVRRTSSQHLVSPAWLDLPPAAPGAAEETVLFGTDASADVAASGEPRKAGDAGGSEAAPPDSRDGDDPDVDLPRGTVCGHRYIVEDPIAVGGMSTVYRAIDDRNGKLVALKVLRRTLVDDPDMVAALEREADNAWMLRDPGFAKVLAQGWIGRQPFLALEYLEGQSLGEAMKGRFATGAPWPVVRRLLLRIGASIAHAHGHGLVHADLKPGNIFLQKGDEPRIIDLGAAQVVHGDSRPDLDRDRDSAGGALTPTYASPEMLMGAAAEPRDDVFSLAVIGYELVTGRHPFDRYTADRARHLDIRPKRPRGVPARAWRTLRRALALRRDKRPPTMAAFVAGLRQPFPIVTVAAGALILAALLAGAFWSRGHPEQAADIWKGGGQAVELTIDMAMLRRLPDRPVDSLAFADRLATSLGWTGPQAALVARLSARMAPEALDDRAPSAIERAVGALVTLRDAGRTEHELAGPTLTVTRAILARVSDLILRPQPLAIESISDLLDELKEVDPDGVRVAAPHLTDMLNERRHALDTEAERKEFDQLVGALLDRFPVLPPPVGGPF